MELLLCSGSWCLSLKSKRNGLGKRRWNAVDGWEGRWLDSLAWQSRPSEGDGVGADPQRTGQLSAPDLHRLFHFKAWKVHQGNVKTIILSWGLGLGGVASQGTSGKFRKYFWFSQLGRGLLPASHDWRPEMLLSILQCTGQPPQQKHTWPQIVNSAEVGEAPVKLFLLERRLQH